MAKLLALFILLPAIELGLLIEIGSRIGTSATIALIVLTGMLGATLARHQGLRVITNLQQEIAEGRLPASPLLDGLMILIASALLVTPGVLTDVFGFLCLIPAFREVVKARLLLNFERAVAEQRVHVAFDNRASGVPFGEAADPFATYGADGHAPRDRHGPIIDVTPEGDERTRPQGRS